MNLKQNKTEGFTLLELIVAIALFMIFAAGLSGTAIGGYLTSLENAKAVSANALLVESWEAVKSIRNNNWSSLTNGTHGFSDTNGYWEFVGSSDTYNGFTRVVTVADVLRDNSGNIVTSSADVDPDIKQVTIDLSWTPSDSQARTLQMDNYVTNYVNPAVWPTPPPEPPPE